MRWKNVKNWWNSTHTNPNATSNGVDSQDETRVVFRTWLSFGGWVREPAQRVR